MKLDYARSLNVILDYIIEHMNMHGRTLQVNSYTS